MARPSISRHGVLLAIEEFDELGRRAFLAKYGFGPARECFVLHKGRRYDCKAMVGAAQNFESPEDGLGPRAMMGLLGRSSRRGRKCLMATCTVGSSSRFEEPPFSNFMAVV